MSHDMPGKTAECLVFTLQEFAHALCGTQISSRFSLHYTVHKNIKFRHCGTPKIQIFINLCTDVCKVARRFAQRDAQYLYSRMYTIPNYFEHNLPRSRYSRLQALKCILPSTCKRTLLSALEWMLPSTLKWCTQVYVPRYIWPLDFVIQGDAPGFTQVLPPKCTKVNAPKCTQVYPPQCTQLRLRLTPAHSKKDKNRRRSRMFG